MNKKKAILLLMWLSCNIAIFYFSGQNGDQSQALSDGILERIFINAPEIFYLLIRKLAHVSEYFLLTSLTYLLVKEYVLQKPYLIAGLYSFLYAGFDEFHQLFVGGRSGQFTDVLIDSIGIMLCLLFCYGLSNLQKKKMK